MYCNRRKIHKLILMYKIHYNLIPSYLFQEHNTTRYTLRNSSHQRNFHAKTNIICNSWFLSTLWLWNELSDSLRDAQSLDIFKRMILSHYPTTKVPPYYFTVEGYKLYTLVFVRKVAVWMIIFSLQTVWLPNMPMWTSGT